MGNNPSDSGTFFFSPLFGFCWPTHATLCWPQLGRSANDSPYDILSIQWQGTYRLSSCKSCFCLAWKNQLLLLFFSGISNTFPYKLPR